MFKNNLAYEASAGSGKTFMLVVRYLSLLFKGAQPSKILALTFTNKAAHEMQERVVQTLEELESRGELDEIVKVTQLSKEYILQERKKILDEFLNSNSKIMTIDKFFTQILRKFSLYASLMPDFSTMNSQHELKLLSRFLKEVSVVGKKDLLINLSLDSDKRVENIFALLDDFYVKKQELSKIRFSKHDYTNIQKDAMVAVNSLNSIVSNSKAASATLKKAVDVKDFYELKDKSWVIKESLNYWVFKKCFTPEMDDQLRIIQDSLQKYYKAKEQNFFYALNELSEIYEKSKKALYMDDSELSFSDVTYLVHYILNEIDDSEFLYFRLDAQIEHMLLDEFQDTSIIQYEILKPLINEIVSGNGIFENGSFFFVGDVKQSIYRFRGGVSALFGAVKEEQRTEVEQLLTNYRSQKEVIEFVNRTFENKIKNYTHQKVRAEASGGYVEIIQNDELVEEALTQVKRLISLGADVNEIAILCATNGDGEVVKDRLQHEGIEVVTETTTKLINQRSVEAVIEYLKYLYFKQDIYKHNFFALINKDVQNIQHLDLNTQSLFKIVKKAIERYELFSDDFHLIRFLSAISRYQDIEAFLFEYERLDTEAAASDLSGVRVLTIHKSKGLEYEHVIVLDRLKGEPKGGNTVIYEYDGISLENIFLRTKNRELLDREYARAIEKENRLKLEDKLNALYVAFTRARDSLFVVVKSSSSSFEVLDLACGNFGELVVEDKHNQQIQTVQQVPFEFHNMYYGTQSEILKLEDESEEDFKAINFGLAMHYMLEMLGDFSVFKDVEDIQTLDEFAHAKDMMINKYGYVLEDLEIADIKNRVAMLLGSKEFLDLVDGECYREKALRYKNNLRYLDLLVKKDSNQDDKNSLFANLGMWNIIDYKSSMSYSSHHLKQVHYYKKAVQEITNDEVNGYICYLLQDEIKIIKV